MTAAATCEAPLQTRRTYSEIQAPLAQAKKLRVVQIGSHPSANRGACLNLTSVHERLQTRGHESVVIDVTANRRVKQPGVHYPRTFIDLARLLHDTPADVLHLHLGGALTLPKLALAAFVSKLPASKKICTLHLGGQARPNNSLLAPRWGATAMILRRFDSLIAINPEVVHFLQHLRIPSERMHLITPFPRLRLSQSMGFSHKLESFCRQHTPLILSVGEFEPGCDLPKQFDILSKIRERYPSAGLLAIGNGSLHFKFNYSRALHLDGNHIEMAGALSENGIKELLQRANVLLNANPGDSNSFVMQEARQAGTPVVGIDQTSRGPASYLPNIGDVEAASLQVLRSLQIARPQYEDAPAALSDGVDDIIRLYKQLVAAPPSEVRTAQTAFKVASVG